MAKQPEVRVLGRVSPALRPTDHPYRTGPFTPNHTELEAVGLTVLEGAVPRDIDGVYIRNTENQVHEPLGRYHPFDGDGMLHAVRFRNGRATYRNRLIPTKGLQAELAEGRALFVGLAEPKLQTPDPRRNGNVPGAQGSLKDSSSTDVVVHAGRAMTSFYQCGDVYSLDAETLEPLGTEPWVPRDGVSAHTKVDTRTGELLFFNYSKQPPHLHYGVVNSRRELAHYVPIPLPGVRLPHDMCFTERYSILNDFPLFWDPKLLRKGVHANRFYPELPSRFAIIPRYGKPEDVRWFEAAPTFVLHFVNAFEEGDEVVLDGYRQEAPMPPSDHPTAPDVPAGYKRMMVYLALDAMKTRLWRWRFNMRTGETREHCLHDRLGLEFGTCDQRRAGLPYRYAYSAVGKPGWFLFNGVVRHDLATGEATEVLFGEQRFGSETHFAPRVGSTDEGDGYLVTLVTDMARDRSECVLYDAARLGAGPVCRLLLPHRISSGTHACWADGAALAPRPGAPSARL
eukprot:TRINITY_DN29612_c0_g1_i1.p1 TRINITY_DN29612_c0_g1~~TRINITY_DN29612_c0_g1_i1.p1  ORF type:complete len:511 (+),score=150.88 TRINITY_DN29612_c0_g1_i1:96-1628(+)